MAEAEADQAAQFAAFQAWQANQGSLVQSGSFADETPPVSIADVLCALVRSARLKDENTVLAYEAVVRDYFADSSVKTGDDEA